MKTAPFSRPLRAFSLLEVITTVAIVGILAGMGYQVAGRIGEGTRQTKLEADVQTVNSAIKVYLANGGSLTGVTNPAEVIGKLKTVRSQDSAARYAGFRGSMLDARVSPVFQTAAESASSRARARWNPAKAVFEVGKTGSGGISGFALDDSAGAQSPAEEERAAGAVDYNAGNGWIWAYRDANGVSRAAPTVIALGQTAPAAPSGPAPAPQLAAPEFVTPPGTYDFVSFPTSVGIRNPNPAGSSTIYVATAWDNSGIQWFAYTGPVPVLPGMQILACARSTSASYGDSFSVGGVYVRNVFPLQAPEIVTSASYLNLQTGDPVTLELIDPNPDSASHRLEYSINGGTFATYSGPLSLSPVSYAMGFAVVAKSVPAVDGISASPEVSQTLSVKLRIPVIEVGVEVRTGTTSIIPVTLSNPNPNGSSVILYALRDQATGATSSYREYQDSLVVDQSAYPQGFTVLAYANPASGNYLASDEATSAGLTFFGIPVTGDAVFVLDRSGSMAWDDGIGQVKAEMNRVLDLLKPENKFAIIQFSTDASVVVSWTAASAQNIETAKDWVNKLTANGWTNYSQALSLALETARKFEVKQVVFLSDGAPTAGDTNPDHILSLVNQLVAEGTRVDTLAFGRITPEGRELLERMDLAGDLRK